MSIGVDQGPAWLTDEQIAEQSPEYLVVFNMFNDVITMLKTQEVDGAIVLNVLFNLHVNILASLSPDDTKIEDAARVFKEAVIAIRDHDPEAYQD